ncbi:MAG: xylulokinase [Pseudomonadota bacterium]
MRSLGLDLGTSGVKALLIAEDQTVLASASAPLDVAYPASGHAEQDAGTWMQATKAAVLSLNDRVGTLDGVGGIGLSGQMHGATLIGEDDAPLHPCLLWNDTRAHAEAAKMDADPRFREITGNVVFPGFTAPKVAWLAKHHPALIARTRYILLPKDALRLWLTGEAVSEMSDASGTSWLDVAARDWSDALLEATGLTRAHMPRLVEGTAVSGTLRADIADELGLPAGIPVAGGAGDNAASAFGVGALSEGDAFVSLGTSGVLFVANDGYRPNAASAVHTFCHAAPGAWHQMGVILSAMGSLEWLSRLTGQSAAALSDAASGAYADSAVRFLPYLSGERTPHNDAAIRGAFLHLDQADGPPQIARAVLDGIAFALADNQAALREAGTEMARIFAVGGGARSAYLLQRIADVTGCAIDLADGAELGAAFGAARLGLIAATGAAPAEIATKPSVARSVEPKDRQAAEDAYAEWRTLYPALKELART